MLGVSEIRMSDPGGLGPRLARMGVPKGALEGLSMHPGFGKS